MTDDNASYEATIALLDRAIDQTAAVIAAIDPSQRTLPTPCSEWDVQALARHVIAQDLRNYIVVARGEVADWQAPFDELGDDWSAEFSARATQLRDAWHNAELDRLVAAPGGVEVPLGSRASQQIAELAIHGWDLVRATGQPEARLDPAIAEHALGWARGMLRPEHRGPGKPFGFEVPVPEEASSYVRLAGWFGRDPGWRPPG